ncbi:hypothetical protein [Chryseobacterium capnotolerans]|uniref:hypothetical protein n=1 Tax=Chryseobacterium capnotolerans TaxID=2759528 RepID=UPI001E64F1F7|nr:hypothetical protein [Chryseobacterium capnotolerans]
MKIKKIEFPARSILSQGNEKFDYADSFEGGLVGNGQNFTIAQIGKAFFHKWANMGKENVCFQKQSSGILRLENRYRE